MTTLIKNGRVIDPANGFDGKINILIENGKIAALTAAGPDADRVIDASGKIVTPGFIDIHMHEDPVEGDRLYADREKAIFACMLRQGVTTALGGNCGDSSGNPADYLDIVERDGCYVNVAMLAGHAFFRYESGACDKYAPTTAEQNEYIRKGISDALSRGCAGVSFGVRYEPGINRDELLAAAAPCGETGKLIAAHVRDDAEAVFASAEEIMELGDICSVPVELSHIGSMAGFGQMQRFLEMVKSRREGGLDVLCDCYPYDAFSTSIGSTTYDEGWLERYSCDYSVLEMCEGEYKGQRCTKEIFEKMRAEHPEYETVCHVMKNSEIDMAIAAAGVMIGSDGVFSHGQGHPRAAGAFPRVYAEYVRGGRLSLFDAVNKMTAMPAKRLGLKNKGCLSVGADADITVFDPETIGDLASFSSPALPPKGIDCVLIGGEIALKNGVIVNPSLGTAVRT